MNEEDRKKFLELMGEDEAAPVAPPMPTSELRERIKGVVGPKGSAARTPSLGDVDPTVGAVINNAPAFMANPAMGAGLFAAEVGMNHLFPPDPSQVRGEMAASAGSGLLNMLTRGKGGQMMKGAGLLKNMLMKGGAQAGAVGLEQAGEVAAGTATPGQALGNTLGIGMAPSFIEGAASVARGAMGKMLLSGADSPLTKKFMDLTNLNLNDLGYTAATGRGRDFLLFFGELPLIEKMRLSRDQRLTEGAFVAFKKLGISPDVAINPNSPGVTDRTLQELKDDVHKAFFVERTFQDAITPPGGGGKVLANVKRGAQTGDQFQIRVNPKTGAFTAYNNKQFLAPQPGDKIITLAKGGLDALRIIGKNDPGVLAQNISSKGSKIPEVLALRALLPIEDAARVKNSFVNQFLLGPDVIIESSKGVSIPTARAVPQVPRTLAVNPLKFRDNIKRFAKEEKLLNVLKLGVPGDNKTANIEAERVLKDLSDLSEFMVKNSADLRDLPTINRFAQYAGNKFFFSVVQPGSAAQMGTLGIAGLGAGAVGAAQGMAAGAASIAAGFTAIITAGAATTAIMTRPGAMKWIQEMGSGKLSENSMAFMRGLKMDGWSFIPTPDVPSEINILPPPTKNETALSQPQGGPQPPNLGQMLSPR